MIDSPAYHSINLNSVIYGCVIINNESCDFFKILTEMPEWILYLIKEYPNLILFIITLLAVYSLFRKLTKFIDNMYSIFKDKDQSKLKKIINNFNENRFIYFFFFWFIFVGSLIILYYPVIPILKLYLPQYFVLTKADYKFYKVFLTLSTNLLTLVLIYINFEFKKLWIIFPCLFSLFWSCLFIYSYLFDANLMNSSFGLLLDSLGILFVFNLILGLYNLPLFSYESCNMADRNQPVNRRLRLDERIGRNEPKPKEIVARIREFKHIPSPLKYPYEPEESESNFGNIEDNKNNEKSNSDNKEEDKNKEKKDESKNKVKDQKRTKSGDLTTTPFEVMTNSIRGNRSRSGYTHETLILTESWPITRILAGWVERGFYDGDFDQSEQSKKKRRNFKGKIKESSFPNTGNKVLNKTLFRSRSCTENDILIRYLRSIRKRHHFLYKRWTEVYLNPKIVEDLKAINEKFDKENHNKSRDNLVLSNSRKKLFTHIQKMQYEHIKDLEREAREKARQIEIRNRKT